MNYRLTQRQWDAVRLCERRGNLRRTKDGLSWLRDDSQHTLVFQETVPHARVYLLTTKGVFERYDVPGELWDRVRLTPEFAAWLKAHDERAERRRQQKRKEER